jgi:hypothetical protein
MGSPCSLCSRKRDSLDSSFSTSLCVAMISIISSACPTDMPPAFHYIGFAHCRLTADNTSLENCGPCHRRRQKLDASTTCSCATSFEFDTGLLCFDSFEMYEYSPLRLLGGGVRSSGPYADPACLLSTPSDGIMKFSAFLLGI